MDSLLLNFIAEPKHEWEVRIYEDAKMQYLRCLFTNRGYNLLSTQMWLIMWLRWLTCLSGNMNLGCHIPKYVTHAWMQGRYGPGE